MPMSSLAPGGACEHEPGQLELDAVGPGLVHHGRDPLRGGLEHLAAVDVELDVGVGDGAVLGHLERGAGVGGVVGRHDGGDVGQLRHLGQQRVDPGGHRRVLHACRRGDHDASPGAGLAVASRLEQVAGLLGAAVGQAERHRGLAAEGVAGDRGPDQDDDPDQEHGAATVIGEAGETIEHGGSSGGATGPVGTGGQDQ